MVRTSRLHVLLCYLRLLVALTVLLAAIGCRKTTTPTPPPTPSPVPTATPGLEQALKDAFFTISLDGVLLATEEIRAEPSDRQTVVFSEMRTYVDYPAVERRTVVLAAGLTAQRYDVELSALNARSTWVLERRGDVVDCLNNNLAWCAPVLVEGISPAPDVMIDSAPSALPFVLLALRYDVGKSGAAAIMRLNTLDILEDLPASRPLTVTTAAQRQGAVIGTLALEGQADGGANPQFTMWVRPAGRLLYSVEISDYRFSLWRTLAHPSLRSGKLVIQRVSKLPEAPQTARPKGQAKRVAMDFVGADKLRRSGTLILPDGNGPFPCLVLQGPGVSPRWDPGDALAARGWAVYSFDKRGLGQSEGTYERDLPLSFAGDAVAAVSALRQRSELNAQRIAYLGLGDAGIAGALAISSTNAYAGAILASCASVGPQFPNLAQQRARGSLASFYRWTPEQLGRYEGVSVRRWQQWLFEGRDEAVLLRRRASLQALKEAAATDMATALSRTKTPVLLLHGRSDLWTPADGARALQERLASAGQSNVKLQVFDNLGADLGSVDARGLFAPEVEQALFAWLSGTLGP